MKKSVIKIAASTAVAASAFVAAAPAQQADAAVNVNQLATDAQNAGTVLKWAISVEGSADFVTRPYDQYNAAKKALAAAEAAAKTLTTSEKLSLNAKLVEPKLQIKRAAAYIDAITSSEKIKDLTSKLDAAIATGDIEKVEAAYHTATAEFRKQAKLLDRVYGQSTRDEIRNAVKPALEKSVASVKNEVTVNMLVKAAAKDVAAGNIAEAHAKIAEAQAIIDANKLKWETDLQKSVNDFKTDLPAIPGNISVETAAFHGEVGQTYAVTATFKTTSGAAYNGPVEFEFDKAGYSFKTANGQPVNASGDTVNAVNGQIVLTVTDSGSAVAGGKIKFATYPNGTSNDSVDQKSSGTLNFYKKVIANDGRITLSSSTGVVKYVDVTNKYFVTTDLQKYTLTSAGNVFQDTNNAVLSLDAFLAKLTKDDVVTGEYYYGNGSTLKLALDYQAGAKFALDQEQLSDTSPLRVEENTVKLSGTGEAGKVVYIYNTANNASFPVAQVQVGSNGIWSTVVSVGEETAVNFEIYQETRTNQVAQQLSVVHSSDNPSITVIGGKYKATAQSNSGTGDGSLSGEVIPFNAGASDQLNDAKVASNAQITVLDGDLTRATFVNNVNGTVITKTTNGDFKVTFGAPTSISGGNGVLNGSLNISAVSGITNEYGLKVNASGSISNY